MNTINNYLAYLMLKESEWNQGTPNPDSFDLKHFRHLIGDLDGIDTFKQMRHHLQPSLFSVFIKNALGDYMGRTKTMNNKAVPHVGFDDFQKELPDIKKKLDFVKKVKDKLPDHFYTVIGDGDNEN